MAEYTEIGKKEKMTGHTEIIDIGGYYEVNLRPIMRIDLFILFFFLNGQKRPL